MVPRLCGLMPVCWFSIAEAIPETKEPMLRQPHSFWWGPCFLGNPIPPPQKKKKRRRKKGAAESCLVFFVASLSSSQATRGTNLERPGNRRPEAGLVQLDELNSRRRVVLEMTSQGGREGRWGGEGGAERWGERGGEEGCINLSKKGHHFEKHPDVSGGVFEYLSDCDWEEGPRGSPSVGFLGQWANLGHSGQWVSRKLDLLLEKRVVKGSDHLDGSACSSLFLAWLCSLVCWFCSLLVGGCKNNKAFCYHTKGCEVIFLGGMFRLPFETIPLVFTAPASIPK